MDPVRKHMNHILRNQKHGKEDGQSAIREVNGEIFMTLERISVRILPYVNSVVGEELRNKYNTLRTSKEFEKLRDQMSSIYGIWAHKAGEYWPLVEESLQNYVLMIKQNNDQSDSIKQQLEDFINNEKPQYLADLVLEERIHRITIECKGTKAKQKLYIKKEKESFNSYVALLKIVKYDIMKDRR